MTISTATWYILKAVKRLDHNVLVTMEKNRFFKKNTHEITDMN